MPNADKAKAARTGGELRFRQKQNAIHNASRIAHNEEKRLNGIHNQLRRFEDNGFGVSTGAQHDHEERMRFEKAKLDAKKAKARAFLRALEGGAFDGHKQSSLVGQQLAGMEDTEEEEGELAVEQEAVNGPGSSRRPRDIPREHPTAQDRLRLQVEPGETSPRQHANALASYYY